MRLMENLMPTGTSIEIILGENGHRVRILFVNLQLKKDIDIVG